MFKGAAPAGDRAPVHRGCCAAPVTCPRRSFPRDAFRNVPTQRCPVVRAHRDRRCEPCSSASDPPGVRASAPRMLEREHDHSLVVLAPVELRDRRLGTGRPAVQQAGERTQPEQPHDLALFVGTCQTLSNDRVVRTRPRRRARSNSRSSSSRNFNGNVAADSPRSKPSNVFATAQPSFTSPTTWSAGVAGVREKHLAELALAVDRRDTTDLDAGLIERAEQEADAVVSRRSRDRCG